MVGMLILDAPASANTSVQISGDLQSAQGELVDDSALWADVDGQINIPAAQQGDTVVVLTVRPLGRCPHRPPANPPEAPVLGTATARIPVLASGDTEYFRLTPKRAQVAGNTTRVCAYLVRAGAVQARGSRRLPVAVAASNQPSGGGNGRGAIVAAFIVVVLVGMGITGVALKRRRRRWHTGRESARPPRDHGSGTNGRRATGRPSDGGGSAGGGTSEHERPHESGKGLGETSPYDVLEVDPEATQEELRAAYRELTMRNHPDRNPGFVSQATERLQAINAAYQLLSDPERRAAYDKQRRRAGQPGSK